MARLRMRVVPPPHERISPPHERSSLCSSGPGHPVWYACPVHTLPDLPGLPTHDAQGDWGTQFGMLIQYMAEKRPGGLNAATDEDVADLQVRMSCGEFVLRYSMRYTVNPDCGALQTRWGWLPALPGWHVGRTAASVGRVGCLGTCCLGTALRLCELV